MKITLNDTIFNEAFNIISSNKSKANSLRLSLLNTINYDNEIILKIRQYLGEFEYDLKILFDILKEIKLSYDNYNILQNSLNKNQNEQDQSQISKDTKNDFENIRFLNEIKEKRYSKDMDNFEIIKTKDKKDNKTKTFNFTINICDRRKSNSFPKKYYNKKINRSNSCRSYLGFNNSTKNNFSIDGNLNIPNSCRNKNMKFRNYLNNGFNNSIFDYKNKQSLRKKSLDLNYEYYPNLTDFSKSKKETKIKKNLYDKDKNNINNNGQIPRNKNIENINEEYKINNLINDYNYSDIKYHYRNDYNENIYKNDINDFKVRASSFDNNIHLDYKYNKENNNNINYNERDNEIYCNENKLLLDENNDYDNYFDQNCNNKRRFVPNLIQNNNNEIIKNENELDENKRKEIIKNVITLVLQDNNRLNILQKYFGDEISENLLKGNLNQDSLYKIIEILKNYQSNPKKMTKNDKNLFRGSRKNYKNWVQRRYNQQRDILLKDSLNNKGFSYGDYPLGFLSMREEY